MSSIRGSNLAYTLQDLEFDGRKIERWLLKVLIGIIWSDTNNQYYYSRDLIDQCAAKIFDAKPIEDDLGMYFLAGHTEFKGRNVIGTKVLTHEMVGVFGVEVTFYGIHVVLFTETGMQTPGLTYRPRDIRIRSTKKLHRISFDYGEYQSDTFVDFQYIEDAER